jgi:bifunctional DNA-binding transcriptional regulator/antitoxin component of YhaV-PrlF toxin-antitoxin module
MMTFTTLNVDDDGLLTFPPELLKEIGWEVGDMIEWIDNRDGSFTLKKDENVSKN